MKIHIILYVSDQQLSTDFYSKIFNKTPRLNVPGMTEFTLNDDCILGLMPEGGIKKLLGDPMPDPSLGKGIPRAEIYLYVDDPHLYFEKAIHIGAKKLSPVLNRDWGDEVGYCLDPDHHVIAFAKAF